MNIQSISLDHIRQFANNPCSFINKEFLTELTGSIREHGLNVPIIVRPVDDAEEFFEVIDGKKRLEACKALGYKQIASVIRKVKDEKEQIILALVTNLQRDTLTPLEVSKAIEKLVDLEVPQREIARLIGKSHSWVHIRTRVLLLEPEAQKLCGPETEPEKRLNLGCALLLEGLPKEHQISFGKKISEEQLSVHEARTLVSDGIRKDNIPLSNNNTSRYGYVQNLAKFTYFITRANSYLDGLLKTEKKKFHRLFERHSVKDIESIKHQVETAQESMKHLADSLEKVKEEKMSSSVSLEIKTANEIEAEKAGDDVIEVNKIKPRTASITQLLTYMGLGRWDLWPRNVKKGKRAYFWQRKIDHKELLIKARFKYMERIKAIHPDVNSSDAESAAVLNSVWDETQKRFKLHGIELNE